MRWIGIEFKVEFVSGSDYYKFDSKNGVVNIPASATAGAISNHATLTVYVNDEQFGGIILFLPKEESEPFVLKDTALSVNGTLFGRSGYLTTDLIDVGIAESVIYKGHVYFAQSCKVYGYDEERNPVRILLKQSANDGVFNVNFDGCRFIRACATTSTEYYLHVIYRDRRRRR